MGSGVGGRTRCLRIMILTGFRNVYSTYHLSTFSLKFQLGLIANLALEYYVLIVILHLFMFYTTLTIITTITKGKILPIIPIIIANINRIQRENEIYPAINRSLSKSTRRGSFIPTS